MALIELLGRADTLKNEIDKLRPITPLVERRIIDKFRLDWNYHSNAIEGNRLTLGETRVLLLEGLTAQGKPLKDSLDIKGHDSVISFLDDFVRKKETLTEASIRGFHKILLHEPYEVEARTPEGGRTKKWVKLGEYKTEPNFAQSPTGKSRDFALPQEVPVKMNDLMQWFRQETEKKEIHPIVFAALFHHIFVRIHPFDDGNGRMARILMNLILMQNGFQPVIIKSHEKEKYIAALIKADAGEITDFKELIASEEINSEELFLKGARGGDISDSDDIDKKIALLDQELSNVAEPVQLDLEIEFLLVTKCLKPCFEQLVKKLGQFDKFYSKASFTAHAMVWSNSDLNSQGAWGFTPPVVKESVLGRIEHVIRNQGIMFSNLQFHFQWSGFKKAGLNIFEDNSLVTVNFNKNTYRVLAQHQAVTVFDQTNVYPHLLTEDEISNIAVLLAESSFAFIERQIGRKK
jgi:Fic family protein